MKTFAALGSSALLFVSSLAYSRPANAAIIWKADFETGNLSQFSSATNATKGTRQNIEIVSEGAQEGTRAGKVTIHPDDLFNNSQMRVQMNRSNPRTGEGQNLYMAFWVKVTTAPLARDNIAYFETNNSYRNVMTWWLAPGAAGGAPTINFGTGNLGPNNQWSGEFSLNQWHQVAFHILWTTNAANGTIKFWFDGKLVRDLKLATKPDGNSLFFQAGIHRASRSDAVDSIFFDNFIEADALADLKIIEGGADGGVSPPADAGAATDTSTPGTGGSSGGSGGNQGAGQTGGTSGGGSGGASGNGSGGSGGAVSSGGTTGAGTGGTGSGSSGGSSGSSGRGGSSGSAAKPSVGYGCSFAGDANLGGGAWLSLLALMSVGWRLGRRRTRQPAGRPQ